MTILTMLRKAERTAARKARLADRRYWAERKNAEEKVQESYRAYLAADRDHMQALDRISREECEPGSA